MVADEFVGRQRELGLLRKRFDWVTSTGAGESLTLRGRRQVGKSRLVREFCTSINVPHMFWTAVKGVSPVLAVNEFLAELKASSIVDEPESLPGVRSGNWHDAFRVLASALPPRPSVVVLDEVPWAVEQDPTFEGQLQVAWDRVLSTRPVLLLLLGSDLHMMERLTQYDRPFYGRASNLRLNPLNPSEVADVVGLTGADALDAHLVSGGLPGVLRTWPYGDTAMGFIERECGDPASRLFEVPETALSSEFPNPDNTRRVLEAIGSGERTRANIATAAGNLEGSVPSGALTPILQTLSSAKHVVAVDNPLSTKPEKGALYRISDSNLRMYMAMLRQARAESELGLADQAFRLVQRRWSAWRGKAIEPLVREALRLAAIDEELPWEEVNAVGGWWNRKFDPEVDLVGADRAPIAKRIHFAGSIKWLGTPFDGHDLSDLVNGARQVPGFDPDETGLVVVSLSGVDPRADMSDVDVVWGPEDVLATWRT